MSAELPQVSVVIPAYNQAQYLAEAIDSVLVQTYRNFEIVVVDDGSVDDTREVVQRYGTAVRYIFQANQGLAGARNTGIDYANGALIALLDSDDRWLPNFLERVLILTDNEPEAAVYYSGWQFIDANGNILPQSAHIRVVPPEAAADTLLRTNFLNCSAVVIRRDALLAVGLFDLTFRRLQDRELWLRLSRAGYIFVGTPECLVHYRIHGSSLSTDPEAGRRAVIALIQKHFGHDDGQWTRWSLEKRRAYGGAYRSCALTSLLRQQDWQACADYLLRALHIDPTLAIDLDLFYELVLGTQPFGYRGTVQTLDLLQRAEIVRELLQVIVSQSDFSAHVCRKAYSTAFYALGLVAYNTEQLTYGRRFLWQALTFRLELLFDLRVTFTLLKCLLGRSGQEYLRRLRNLQAKIKPWQ
jgi:glycosyltransferase involved in cell wall biosynthesis